MRKQAGFLEAGTSFRAMNTLVEAQLYLPVPALPLLAGPALKRAERALQGLRQLFEEAESGLSRFRPESELSRLNRQGRLSGASPLLFESVQAALALAELSGGIYDPAILEALEAAGYNASFEQLTGAGPDRAAPPVFGAYRGVRLDPATRAIELPPGVRLDLGGSAKGLTVDRAAARLRQAGYRHFLVNAGGDMYLRGRPPGSPQGWEISLLDPLTLSGAAASLKASDRAAATSAITRRRWVQAGQERHHLIDPRSGQPAESGLLSVTVLAASAGLADVLAKTALILGPQAGKAFLMGQPDCEAIFIDQEGRLETFQTSR